MNVTGTEKIRTAQFGWKICGDTVGCRKWRWPEPKTADRQGQPDLMLEVSGSRSCAEAGFTGMFNRGRRRREPCRNNCGHLLKGPLLMADPINLRTDLIDARQGRSLWGAGPSPEPLRRQGPPRSRPAALIRPIIRSFYRPRWEMASAPR